MKRIRVRFKKTIKSPEGSSSKDYKEISVPGFWVDTVCPANCPIAIVVAKYNGTPELMGLDKLSVIDPEFKKMEP